MTFRAFRPPVRPPPFVGRLHGGPAPACTLIMEITTPDGNDTVPMLSGWALRTWPVARLGDVTLEAQARFPHLGGEDLRKALDAQGYRILGPVHARQISAAEKCGRRGPPE